MYLTKFVTSPAWQSAGLLIARIVIAASFVMACAFKFLSISGTADQIAGVGLPFPLVLAWLAAIFEVLVVLAFVTGSYFREMAFLTMLYILFLAFMFHGPSHWTGDMYEFGFFVDHFTFAAGLIALVAAGPGRWRLPWGN